MVGLLIDDATKQRSKYVVGAFGTVACACRQFHGLRIRVGYKIPKGLLIVGCYV